MFGLPNSDNRCWLNCVIQILLACELIRVINQQDGILLENMFLDDNIHLAGGQPNCTSEAFLAFINWFSKKTTARLHEYFNTKITRSMPSGKQSDDMLCIPMDGINYQDNGSAIQSAECQVAAFHKELTNAVSKIDDTDEEAIQKIIEYNTFLALSFEYHMPSTVPLTLQPHEQVFYSLVGVVWYSGSHYICTVKHNHNWYICDDNCITDGCNLNYQYQQASPREGFSARMLFYQLI